MKRLKSLLIGLVAVVCLNGVALAGDGPRDIVVQTSDQMLAKLKSERNIVKENPRRTYDLVSEIVLPHFDFETMARWVLGRNWRNASPDQRQRFIDEFRTLLVRTYAVSLADYRDQKVVVEPVQAPPEASDVVVRTTVEQPGGGQPITVDYSMHRKDADWKVYDVVVNGVSLVTNYRSSFASEIRNVGMDGLIQKLADRNDKLAS